MSETDDTDVLRALASLPTMAHPTASPDGDRVALYYDVTGRNELHVLDAATGQLERWSDGEVPRNARWPVEWAADGDRVLFHLDDAGDEQNDIYTLSEDGTVEPVVEMGGQVTLEDVGADGQTLLLGSSRDGQMNLYRHDLASGETEKVTDYERAAFRGSLSPDCDRIAYSTNEADDYENVDAYVASVDGSNPRNLRIGDTGAEVGVVDWGPDGDRLLVSDNTEDLGRCGICDLRTDEVTWYGDRRAEEEPVGFLPDGERFLALRTRDAVVVPVVYDVSSGGVRELGLAAGVAEFTDSAPVLADGRLLLSYTTSSRRPELLAYDLATDEYEVLLEAEYGPFDPDDFTDAAYFTFESTGHVESEVVEWTEPDEALEIGALLYDSGERPSPLVMNPHGGPRWADYGRFDLFTQFLVRRGYSVLKVNYRGSTGRGRAFVEELYDDWGGAEQADIAEAARLVSAYDWIDDDRVAVLGGSYGGYSAFCQTTMYPDLYDAGVAWIGLTDLRDMFENTMPHFRTELMEKYLGAPGETPGLYDERSPVNYVEHLRAPLLVVHGVNDRRVPVSQARIFRDALEEHGFQAGEGDDYEYVELDAEGHGSSDIDQKIRRFRVIDGFLARRLGERSEVTADD